jgi:DNA-binding beta-propeller fold protein YncE
LQVLAQHFLTSLLDPSYPQMPRRVDALYSSRDNVKATFEKKRQEMKASAAAAKKMIDESINETIDALKKRQSALHKEVDELLDKKSKMLTDQQGRAEEKKADEERKLIEDEKLLSKLEEAQKTGKPMDGADKLAAGDNPDWANLRIRTLTASIAALKADNPEWLRLKDDEVVSFKPKRKQELSDMVNMFGAVDGTSTYASESTAAGPLIEGPLKVGFKTWLLIRACDLHGRQRSDGGDKLICKWSQDSRGPKHFEEELIDNDDGTYKLNVVPMGEGTYTLTVEFENPSGDGTEQIKGSPFKVLVTAPFDYTVLGDDTLGQAGVAWIDDAAGFLRRPSGIQFDPRAEFLFVADQCNDRIQAFSMDTKMAVSMFGKKGSGPKDLNTPGYIVCDRDDRVIVSDTLNHRLQVLRFNRSNNQLCHLRSVGLQGDAEGQFSFPRGIALTQTGLLLIADAGNDRIQAVDANKDFSFAYTFGEHGSEEGKFIQPYDVAVNSNDEILVTDSCHRVQVFDVNGKFLRQFGVRGKKKAGKFRHPTSITVDNEDTIFVCDQGNHRVQVFSPMGEFKHMWGGWLKKKEVTEEEQAEDPAADDGEWYGLLTPIGITVSPAGQVFVADYDKHVVFDF